MGLDITFVSPRSEVSYQLASANGWGLVIAWVEKLPSVKSRYPHALALVLDGETEDSAALARELKSAIKAYPPKNVNVRHTLVALLKNMDDGAEDEQAVVTS
jgi:hypothetical protein